MGKHIKVLVINGGGIRGILPATILEHLSAISKKQIPELFDFVIGTSIGGILSAAYVTPKALNSNTVKFTASEVLNIIKENAKTIFPLESQNNWPIFKAKYSRDGIDKLLNEKFKVAGADLKLKDTLIPIALTSQNAISNEPQTWFSCDKTSSSYLLKDITGATSAAPVYFPAKYIPVQNQKDASSKDCQKIGLEKQGDTCQHKSIDGGLFANAPAFIVLHLLRQIMTNEITNECSTKYPTIQRLSSSNEQTDFTVKLSSKTPQISLGPDMDITVVSLGTGYSNYDNAGEIAFQSTVTTIISLSFYVGLISLLTTPAIQYYAGAFSLYKTLAGVTLSLLSGGVHYLATQSRDGQEGYIGAIKNNIVEEILYVNEASDHVISRDVFGVITINPKFNQTKAIPLDAVDSSSISILEKTAKNFITINGEGFRNLSKCLSNTEQRIEECDYANNYFYSQDSLTHRMDIVNSLHDGMLAGGLEATVKNTVNTIYDLFHGLLFPSPLIEPDNQHERVEL